MLQANYYSRLDFLIVGTGCRPSYIWQFILFGQELLFKGLRWRIEDDKTVRAFHDP